MKRKLFLNIAAAMMVLCTIVSCSTPLEDNSIELATRSVESTSTLDADILAAMIVSSTKSTEEIVTIQSRQVDGARVLRVIKGNYLEALTTRIKIATEIESPYEWIYWGIISGSDYSFVMFANFCH